MSDKFMNTTWPMRIICVIVLGLSMLSAGCGNGKEAELFVPETPEIKVADHVPEQEGIVVEIKGEVVHPGVYTMNAGARLNDLLQVSGGPKDSADLRQVNLAMKVLDGESFYIPSEGEDIPVISGGIMGDGTGKIDLNSATREELMSVTGIGPSTADNILAYREANGRFNSVEDLLSVNRIGEKTLDKIRDYFMVR